MLANTGIQKLYAKKETGFNYSANQEILSSSKFSRIKVVNSIALLLTAAVIFRLIYMNTFGVNFLAKQMSTRIERTIKVIAMRGTITDRNGSPLAVSTPVASIWVDPTDLDDLTLDQIKQIANILHLPLAEVNTKMNEKNKTFVYLKRAVSPEQAKQIKALEIDGIYDIQEFKRYYPSGEVAAHIVGFNNIDDRGAEGMEYADNKELLGVDGSHRILRDRQGHIIEDLGATKVAQNGKTVVLAVDNRIQYIAYNALKTQVEKMHAKSGSVVVLDAKTGEVLSMVNIPTFNPNNRDGVTQAMIKNTAIVNVYDPGSIMKPIVIAKALDDKIVTPKTIINTSPYSVGPKLIKDEHHQSQSTVEEVLIHSSDIGTSKIALRYKPEVLSNYYHSVGFGEKMNTGFPGETRGILLNWKKWHPIDQALNSFGYGISVSLLQMAHAYTEFTNEGCILPVSFYKVEDSQPVKCNRVISPATADIVRTILAKNNEVGTGVKAQVNDYTTAGKTGTAQILINGHYSNHDHVASFVGFAPVNNPRLVIAVAIDSPKGTYYGSTVSAPVFSQITGPSLHLLGVKPDRK